MESSRGGMLSTLIMTIPLIVVPAIALLRPPAPGGTAVTGSVEAGTESDELDLEGFENELNGQFGSSAVDSAEETDSPAKKGPSRNEGDEWSELFPEDSPRDTKKNKGSTKSRNQPPVSSKEIEQPFGEEVSPSHDATGASSGVAPEFSDFEEMADSDSGINDQGSVSAEKSDPAGPRPPGRTPQPQPSADDTAETEQLISELNKLGVSKCIWFTTGDTELHGFAAFLKLQDPEFLVRFEAIGESRSAAVRDVIRQVRSWKNSGVPSGTFPD